MRVSLRFDSVNVEEMRAILAQCSVERENFFLPDGEWQPRVCCNGPEMFAVEVSPISSVGAATRILRASNV